MIISTLSTYPGKKVAKDLGIIFSYDNSIRAFRKVMDMEIYLNKAFEELETKAKKIGANAVLGVCFDVRDDVKPLLMGTAVVLEDE